MNFSHQWSANGAVQSNPGAIAFYYPQFHVIDLNEEHFGQGFTEWAIVDRAKPLFEGHRQPRVPADLGRYDLTDPGVWERQVEMALGAGLAGFCFYHYWFGPGDRLLEKPLQTALESDTQFPFCLMWANHDWTRVWDGDPNTVTKAMSYEQGHGRAFIDESAAALLDPRYLRVDSGAVLLIFDIDSPPNLDGLIQEMRTRAREIGVGELFVSGVQRGRLSSRTRSSALDAVCEFPPMGYNGDTFLCDDPPAAFESRFSGRVFDYDRVVAASLEGGHLDPEVRWFQTAVPDWDNTGRRLANLDPWLFGNASVEAFRDWIIGLLAKSRTGPNLPLVFINAWNEWGEGAYLEPDAERGTALLRALAEAIDAADEWPGSHSHGGGVGLRGPDRVAFAQTQAGVDNRAASAWAEQLGFVEPPFDEPVEVNRHALHRLRGFVASPDIVDAGSQVDLYLEGHFEGSPSFVASLVGRDRIDLLKRHGSWMSEQTTAGAGFDGWVSFDSVPPGLYRLSGVRGLWGGELAQMRIVD